MLLPGFVLGVPVTKHSTTLEALHSIPLFYKESIKATEGVNNYVNSSSHLKWILSIFYHMYVKKYKILGMMIKLLKK